MFKKIKTRLLANGWHCIVGISLILNGIILVINRHYFFWPPSPKFITAFLNDDIVGYTGVLLGLGMIYWAYQESGSLNMNRFLLAGSSAFYTMLGLTELMHSIFAFPSTPRMMWGSVSDLIMVLATLYMARESPTKK